MNKRVNILTTVNAKNVTREGDFIHIRDVVPVVSGIVMNGLLYGDDALSKGVMSLNQAPAPAGHPRDSEGNYISAKSGEALSKSYIGAYVHNARHADGKTLCDISVNEAQAKAMPEGIELLKRLDAAMNGADIEPIHVSTGLMLNIEQIEGVSMGKKYRGNVKDIAYDHLAILLNQEGAGTPSQGVGMFLNAEGAQEQVETVTLELNQQASVLDHVKTAIMNALALFDTPINRLDEVIEVANQGETAEQTTNSEESQMKEQILAALNAAGVGVEGLTDAQILAAYNSVVTKPVQDKLSAANSKVAEFEQAARAVVELEVNELATKLAVNSSLTVDDFKALPVERLRELSKSAAPIAVGNTQEQPANEWAGYDLNSMLEGK